MWRFHSPRHEVVTCLYKVNSSSVSVIYTALYWGIFFLRSKSLQEGSTEAAACQLTILDAASDLPSCMDQSARLRSRIPLVLFLTTIQRDWLLATTPEAFRRRNIFIGGSVLDNKYELHQMFGSKPRWTPWSDQELQHLLASNDYSIHFPSVG